MRHRENAIPRFCTQHLFFLVKGKSFRIMPMCDRFYSGRFVDIVEVASSILAIPTRDTNFYKFLKANLTIYKKL